MEVGEEWREEERRGEVELRGVDRRKVGGRGIIKHVIGNRCARNV